MLAIYTELSVWCACWRSPQYLQNNEFCLVSSLMTHQQQLSIADETGRSLTLNTGSFRPHPSCIIHTMEARLLSHYEASCRSAQPSCSGSSGSRWPRGCRTAQDARNRHLSFNQLLLGRQCTQYRASTAHHVAAPGTKCRMQV